MYAYSHYILEDDIDKSTDKPYYELKEIYSLSVSNNYILKLHNNQDREVIITSNKSFDKFNEKQQINFFVKDIVTFSSYIDSSKISFKLEKDGTYELMKYWLYHIFLPILLTAENKYYFLHAGSICIDDSPILFIANSFGGKSTLTDHFIKKGHIFVSDDKVGTFIKNDEVYCTSSYPYHRPYRKVEDLGLYVESFFKEQKKISYIFNLVKSDASAKIEIEELKSIEKFKALRYSSDVDLPIHKDDRFNLISKITNDVPIYNITIPWDIKRLDEVYSYIINFIKEKNES